MRRAFQATIRSASAIAAPCAVFCLFAASARDVRCFAAAERTTRAQSSARSWKNAHSNCENAESFREANWHCSWSKHAEVLPQPSMKNECKTTHGRLGGLTHDRVVNGAGATSPARQLIAMRAMRTRRRKQQHWSSAVILAESTLFAEYQQSFAATTGLKIELRCAQAKKPARESQRGLREIRIPVRYGNRVMAFLETSFALLKVPPVVNGNGRNGGIEAQSATATTDTAGAADAGIRSLAPEQSAGVASLLTIFSRQLADWFVRHAASDPRRSSIREFHAREWIEAHYHEPITLADAAAAMDLSIWYFSHRFRAMTGTNFQEFLRRTRVAHAQRLLADPQLPVLEVAKAVGFGSISQFVRVFRRVVGQPAGEFRAAIQSRSGSAPDSFVRPSVPRVNGAAGQSTRPAHSANGSAQRAVA